MKTLRDMQATRLATTNLGTALALEDLDNQAGFTYYGSFYITAGAEPLGTYEPGADCFAVMYYCDVFNEGIKSRNLYECEEFLYNRLVKDEVQ